MLDTRGNLLCLVIMALLLLFSNRVVAQAVTAAWSSDIAAIVDICVQLRPSCITNAPNYTLQACQNVFSSLLSSGYYCYPSYSQWQSGPCAVFCMRDSTAGRATKIIFPGVNMNGLLPSSLVNLNYLNELDISRNNGLDIPSLTILSNLVNLTTLSLSSNAFGGPFPTWVSSLTSLSKLDLSSNDLTGAFPSAAVVSPLMHLNVSNNQLTDLPPEIGTLTGLTFLDASRNALTSLQPIFATSGSANLDLSFAFNSITGPLPNLIGHTRVRSLDLSFNPIGGLVSDLPASFTMLRDLKLVSVGLSGNVSSFWTALTTRLTRLDMSYNSLSGNIDWVSSLPYLSSLALDYNQFSGKVTAGSSHTLLTLSNNQLSGPLPPYFFNNLQYSLRILNLANNMLNGTLALASYGYYFQSLNFNNNFFTGTLPFTLAGYSQLTYLGLANNPGLRGALPPITISSSVSSFSVDMTNTPLCGNWPFNNVPSIQSCNVNGSYWCDSTSLSCIGTTLANTLPNVLGCAGSCASLICRQGTADCNGNYLDGCETDLFSTLHHCGSCPMNCSNLDRSSTLTCNSGVCLLTSCPPSRGDCDQVVTNGCEIDFNTDPANCGQCRSSCLVLGVGSATCTNGFCSINQCQAGFLDCDGIPSNGCEVDSRKTTTSCGFCGISCYKLGVDQATCINGTCSIQSCQPSFANCDGGPSNGCETRLSDSQANCGSCGYDCSNLPKVTTAYCENSGCHITTCDLGWADCDLLINNGCEYNCPSTSVCYCLTLTAITSNQSIPILVTIGVVLAVLIAAAVVGIFFVRRLLRHKERHTLGQIPPLLKGYVPAAFPTSSVERFSTYSRMELQPGSQEYAVVHRLLARYADASDLLKNGALVKVWSVYNKDLMNSFVTQHGIWNRRIHDDQKFFNSKIWNSADRQHLRQFTIQEFLKTTQRSPWSLEGDPVNIIPVVHGTAGSVAWKIVANGFSALSGLDAGYYGAGIYFTSSCNYALPYYASKAEPSVLLCALLPGNPYPVVEDKNEPKSLMGEPIKAAYQSHYVLTAKDGIPITEVGTSHFDEIVIGQEAQVVPLYLAQFDTKAIIPIAKRFMRRVEEPPGEAAFIGGRAGGRNMGGRQIEIEEPKTDMAEMTDM